MFSKRMYLFKELRKPKRGENRDIIQQQFADMPKGTQYIKTTLSEVNCHEKLIKEPSRKKLLPVVITRFHRPQYMLILECTRVIVHPDWRCGTSWRFQKRSGGSETFSETFFAK